MTAMRYVTVLWMLALAPGIVSCKDEAACETSRIALSKRWQELKDTAANYKVTKEDEDLSVAKKEERLKVWSAVEEKAGLLESAFFTRQVTWASADKARTEIQQRLQAVAATGDSRVESYSRLLAQANAEYDQFKSKCK